ncbi:3-hydroxyisobutyrate dehydrogenase, partial [Thraustotheca clavata]
HLSLSTNSIDRLIPLSGMKKLRILSLGRNQIKKIEKLDDVSDTLEELWISYNVITTLDGLSGLTNLTTLYISNNLIKSWDELDKLSNLPKLRDVLFSGNPIYEGLSKEEARLNVLKRLRNVMKIDGDMVKQTERDAMLRVRGASIRCLSSSAPSSKVGFIGLGQMGGHMARNLAKAGNHLVVFDVVDANVQAVKGHGTVDVAASPREVAKNCSTVITMLPSTPHVQEVYLGKNGLVHELTKDHFLIDSSTIDPGFTKTLASTLAEKGATMIDAPVSGGVNGAKNGTLTFMVGGSQAAYEKSQLVLKQMGKNIVHCGDVSTGQAAKLCNNLALAIQMTSVAEALTLGDKLGIDPKVLSGIMNTSTSQCWSSSLYNPYPGVMEGVPSSNDYNGGFASVLMRKDLGLAIEAAKSVEASVPLTASVHAFYNMIVNQGHGGKDFGYILKFLEGKDLPTTLTSHISSFRYTRK